MRLITRLSKTRVRERMERRVEAAAYHQQEVHARDLEMPMYEFREVDDAKDAHYAILSHRWNSIDEEITFDDIRLSRPLHSKPKGRQKLECLLDQANKDGLTCVWIDTCCIDKSSSAELSEAINSMYYWYQTARKCYAFLWDISAECPRLRDGLEGPWLESFARSEWFSRGW